MKHGEGVYRYKNGDIYSGGYDRGYWHGPGKFIQAANGEVTIIPPVTRSNGST